MLKNLNNFISNFRSELDGVKMVLLLLEILIKQ